VRGTHLGELSLERSEPLALEAGARLGRAVRDRVLLDALLVDLVLR
jgi:hypothetical protein